MSAFARLAMITKNRPTPQKTKMDGEPMSESERSALEAARRAAPPLPAPVISFAPEGRVITGGWLARLRAAILR